ncbi:hypothetical protein O181_021369 [Austropuccinia psidii MF-1]|uniref:Uncharacterized protein n=1 Tax=Austropuccinia psidii MF-1 TaxID=1389203 RepID=A0A9Q3CD05_9BASI|nr:hypothetical protein [Austropuccinia psidii MF-1]
MNKSIKQRMEKDSEEGNLLESEDFLNLYQQNNGNQQDKYKQGRSFEDLEEGDLSENTQRLAEITFLEPNQQELHDSYEKICCFSNI